jgi:hypothetical protein
LNHLAAIVVLAAQMNDLRTEATMRAADLAVIAASRTKDRAPKILKRRQQLKSSFSQRSHANAQDRLWRTCVGGAIAEIANQAQSADPRMFDSPERIDGGGSGHERI